MKAQPLFTLDGNMRIISIALMVCCGVQVFLALFYLFATFQFTGMTLMFIPFLVSCVVRCQGLFISTYQYPHFPLP